jgi:deoxyadenosine/deoxycytidine kinase
MSHIISIEGNIGAGKSTIIEHLKHCHNYVVVPEPVDQWATIVDKDGISILEHFYNSPKGWAFAFQMMAYISRLSLLKQTIKDNPTSIIITERSLHTDKYVFCKMLYDSGDINHIEYSIYLKWFDDFIAEVPIDSIIYMTSNTDVCMNRIKKRNRPGETIDIDYLNKCDKYHTEWIESLTIPVKYINADEDMKTDASILDRAMLVSSFIHSSHVCSKDDDDVYYTDLYYTIISMTSMALITYIILNIWLLFINCIY